MALTSRGALVSFVKPMIDPKAITFLRFLAFSF